MVYLGTAPLSGFSRINKQTIIGNNGTTYTLDYPVANEQEIEVYVNNVRQNPGVAYSVSGTTLTMISSISASDSFYVIFQGKAERSLSIIPERESNGNYSFDLGTLYVDSVNNEVGIGTTAPTSNLHVIGTANITSTLTVSGNTTFRNKFEVIGSSASAIQTLSDAATITPNFGSNNNFQITISGNRTIANPTGLIPGQSGIIYIQQGIGSNTLSWGNVWRFTDNTAPTLSTANNSVDAIVYSVKNTTSIIASVIYNVG